MNYEQIPDELKNINRWIYWKKIIKDERAIKLCCDAYGNSISVTDPNSYLDFNTAIENYSNYVDGLGFVLGDNYCGIDIDSCIDNDTITKEAERIINTVNSYTEISQSGKGIHIIFKGTIPDGKCRNGSYEFYKDKRYFAITGDMIPQYNRVNERTKEVESLYYEFICPKAKVLSTLIEPLDSHCDIPLEDKDIYTKIINSKKSSEFKSLCDFTPNEDKSLNDYKIMCLIALYTDDYLQIERILLNYTNRNRDKWIKRKNDYLYKSIKEAIEETAPARNKRLTMINKKVSDIKMINTNILEPTSEYINYIPNAISKGSSIKYGNTGLANLDNAIGGIYSALYIIGAMSALGKTTLVYQIADNIAQSGTPVIYVTLEQTKLELICKSLSRQYYNFDVPFYVPFTSTSIRLGNRDFDIYKAIAKYKESGISDNMFIYEGNFNTTIEDISLLVKTYIDKYNKKPVVIIDYLQIIQIENSNLSDKQRIDEVIKEIKNLQKSYDIPVIAISSINRNSYNNSIDYSSFKESGIIEYSTDVLISLELSLLDDVDFKKAKDFEKYNMRINALKQIPREVTLKILKNRLGECYITDRLYYYPNCDTFIEHTPSTQLNNISKEIGMGIDKQSYDFMNSIKNNNPEFDKFINKKKKIKDNKLSVKQG